MGYKLAEYVTELLGLSFSEDEELVCIAETDSCTVDAIQVFLGCTAGKGNLFVNKWGKTAFSFYNRKTGKSVRLVAIPDAVPRPAEMTELRKVVFSGKATEAEHARYDELSDIHVEEILATDASNLFEVKETGYDTVGHGVDATFDFWFDSLNADGVWNPNFSWGIDSDISRQVTTYWTGYVTVKRVKILKNFNRIE